MKKISKILLSICMLFVVSFSLVACSFQLFGSNSGGGNSGNGGDNSGNGGGSSQTYTPPEGVDMTSADSYANYLLDNADTTISYKITIVDSSEEFNEIRKYNYKDGVSCVASYDENNQLVEYGEYEIFGDKVIVRSYNLDEKTYKETLINNDENFYIGRVNSFDVDTYMYLFLNLPERNYNYDIPDDMLIYKKIEKIDEGTYKLKKKIFYSSEEGTISQDLYFTCKNDKVIKMEFSTIEASESESNNYSMTISVDYEDYEINLDTSKFDLKF